MNFKFYSFRTFFFMACIFTSMSVIAQSGNEFSALLPMPNYIETVSGPAEFQFTEHTVLKTNLPSSSFCKDELQRIVKERMGITLSECGTKSKARQTIELQLDPSVMGKEHYLLEVSKHKVSIKASTETGIYYGLKTLDQLLLGDVCRTSQHKLALIRIDDEPRFGHRALMLDPARNFLPIDDVKFYIEQMARYKFNVLQLHLTDDQGWRIEIKSHPELTNRGAFRNPKGKKEGPDNGFYTQEQLRDLIAFASRRGIEIIPELDIPGHTVAVLAAFPNLGCSHISGTEIEPGKTVNMMLCACQPGVYELYDDVIREVSGLFPSPQIHLGGDEAAISQNWGKCSLCQNLKKKLGYQKDSQLMNYFFQRILTSVKKYGKKPTLWCELDNVYMPANEYLFDYPAGVTLVTWRMGLTPKCIELTAKYGHQLIMAPGEYAYLDYPQMAGDLPEFNNWGMPVTTLKKCYEFDPGYGLPSENQSHIQGVMGTLWGEAIKDINRLTYMTYPRGLAIAEAGWTQMEHRNWNSFQKRMYPNLMNLMLHGVSFRVPFEVLSRDSY